MSQVDAIRGVTQEIKSLNAGFSVYDGLSDEEYIPEALNELPVALVTLGPSTSRVSLGGQYIRHSYEVQVTILTSVGWFFGDAHAATLGWIDDIIERFAKNVRLTERVEAARIRSASGMESINVGDLTYIGYEIVIDIEEQRLLS